MSDFTHSPKKSTKVLSLLVISLITLVLFGTCSKPKYNVIVINGVSEVLFFKMGGKEISVDADNLRYLGSFAKDNYDWSATIGTSSFGGNVYIDQDRNFILYGQLNGEYFYEWR